MGVKVTNLAGSLQVESELGMTVSKSRHWVIMPGDREERDWAHKGSSTAKAEAAKAV